MAELQFNRQEMGQLTIRFQITCSRCSMAKNKVICETPDRCPVGISRSIMNHYLKTSELIIKDFDFNSVPQSPPGITYNKNELTEIFNIVHNLCMKCMFHVNNCFLNVTYTLLESMLAINPKKLPEEKPGNK